MSEYARSPAVRDAIAQWRNGEITETMLRSITSASGEPLPPELASGDVPEVGERTAPPVDEREDHTVTVGEGDDAESTEVDAGLDGTEQLENGGLPGGSEQDDTNESADTDSGDSTDTEGGAGGSDPLVMLAVAAAAAAVLMR